MKICASDIVALLAQRHEADVFVPECKGGPSSGVSHDRMDAWAMKKSWARPLVWAYEVKVSRRDFLGDQKWQCYLPYCNEFYFVCPAKLIQPDELPPEAGLMYVATTGSKLFTKKPAVRRSIDIPEDLWRYLLMCRVKIKGENDEPVDKLEYWRWWLAEKREARSIGVYVREGTAEYVGKIERENSRLKRDIEALEKFKAKLNELGVNVDDGVRDWQIQDAMVKLCGQIPRDFMWAIDSVEKGLSKIRECVEGGRKLAAV
jgi:hypothetical protein